MESNGCVKLLCNAEFGVASCMPARVDALQRPGGPTCQDLQKDKETVFTFGLALFRLPLSMSPVTGRWDDPKPEAHFLSHCNPVSTLTRSDLSWSALSDVGLRQRAREK